jgi:hypothetical protein
MKRGVPFVLGPKPPKGSLLLPTTARWLELNLCGAIYLRRLNPDKKGRNHDWDYKK